MAVVQLVDQVHEAACGIVAGGIHARDAADQHGVELARDLDVVVAAARAFAQGGEVEPAQPLAARAYRDAAAIDHDPGLHVRGIAAKFVPALPQPGVGLAVQRGAVDRRAGQRTQAVVGIADQFHHFAMALQCVDRGQEARALQAVLVQVAGGGIGAGDQHHALGKQAVQQARQQHGIADVADEELVQYQHAQGAAPFAGDRHHRVALTGMRAQALVHFAHEPVEMRAAFLSGGQAGIEQVDQEGLAAAHATPQVQALRRGFGRVLAQHACEQAAHRHGLGERLVDAVQRLQCGQLGRVMAPVTTRHALGVAPGRQRIVVHAAGGAGSQPRTPLFTAPRRSISLRWKKWLASGIRTSSGCCGRVSSQA